MNIHLKICYLGCDNAAELQYTVYLEFSRYVNFMDFAVSRAAVKIYSVKILPSLIIYEYVTLNL